MNTKNDKILIKIVNLFPHPKIVAAHVLSQDKEGFAKYVSERLLTLTEEERLEILTNLVQGKLKQALISFAKEIEQSFPT